MQRKILWGSIASVWLACGLAAAAQAPAAAPADSQASPAVTITVAGCVKPETDVIKRSAAVGEVGMGDEFVLIHAALNPKPAKEGEPAAEAPVGTSGSAGNFGKVYRVTGDKENELKPFVNQRVEITGAFKNDTDAKAELASVGTSGRAAAGELTPANTPEITITAIKPVTGMCASGGAK